MPGAQAIPAGRPRVAMMVQNDVEFDTRVRKEAESMAQAGYEVRVFGRTAAHLPDREEVHGVTYERVPLANGLAARITRAVTLFGSAGTAAGRTREGVPRRLPRPAWLAAAASLPVRLTTVIDARLALVIRAIYAAEARSSARRCRARYLLAPLVALRRAAALAQAGIAVIARAALPRWSRLGHRRLLLWRRRIRLGRGRMNRRLRRLDRSLRRGLAPLSLHVDWAVSVSPRLEDFEPDVVHAHDLNTLLAGWRHKRRHGCRLIYDAHELELHRNQEWTRFKRWVARTVELLGIRASDGVITVSPLIADDLARTYRIRRPEVVLNSPPLPTRDREPALDLRATAGLDGTQRLSVYVGGVLYRRGHEQLVEALVHLPETHHVGVLGPRKPLREAPLIEMAQRLGVDERLHFFGAVSADQVPATLAGADATIIPIPNVCRSYDFALPNKLFDAVMAGIPIGVSRLRHMRDFVTEHELGVVVDETDPRSIARGLEQLVESTRPGVADQGRLHRLQEQVAWERQADILLELYHRVLGRVPVDREVAVTVAPSSGE